MDPTSSSSTSRKRVRWADAPNSKKKPMDFSTDDPAHYDGVVRVEGQNFYICKHQLARQSEFFRNLFFQGFEESKQDVIELKEVSAEAFQLFLELISGYNRLSDDNIEGITKISAMWQADIPLGKCLKFLMKKSEFTEEDKLILADKYDLAVLKDSLFEDVTSILDMEVLLPDMDIASFKPDTILMIAKKFMEINEVRRPMPPDSPIVVQVVDSDPDDSDDEEGAPIIGFRRVQRIAQAFPGNIGRLLPPIAQGAAPQALDAPGRVGEAQRNFLGEAIRLRNLQQADRNAQNAPNGLAPEGPAAPIAPGLAPRAQEENFWAPLAAELAPRAAADPELAPRGLGAPDLFPRGEGLVQAAPAAPEGIQVAPRAQLPYAHAFGDANAPQNYQNAVWNEMLLRNAQNAQIEFFFRHFPPF
ncbi:hypothetical protein L5515_015745 [Caenorhabditis briggsae]|uniref:BTB domain-containing protein n=1 Tax=Caenorhabditis briggsae TaxID=6238 RepID=A0AAE9EFR5_CAEBR|nr:hypothetical protein L5515_015745 [Caenorhabditis briggsae]